MSDAPSPWELADPEPRRFDEPLSAWLPARRSAGEVADLLGQIVAAEARLAALRVELVMDLAAARLAPADPLPGGERAGTVGPAGVSEFVPDELAAVHNCSRAAAVTLLEHVEVSPPGCRPPSPGCGWGCWTGPGPGRSPRRSPRLGPTPIRR
ncbi:hypothetical protein ACI79P_18785 [Blastococcus sp. SYSU DS0510]